MTRRLLACLIAVSSIAFVFEATLAQPKPPFPLPGGPPPLPVPPNAVELRDFLTKIGSSDGLQRLQAVENLPELPPAFVDHATALLAKAAADENAHVRLAALNALASLGPQAKLVVPVIDKRVTAADSDYERAMAAWTITQMTFDREQLAPLIPTLVETLGADSVPAANQAAAALREIGRPAEKALAASLAGETNTRKASLALECLGYMGARDSAAAVADRLADESVAIRASAAGAVASIGPSAKGATPKLISLLEADTSPAVRSRAATALGNFDEASPEVVTALVKGASDPDATVARASLESLLLLEAEPEVVNPVVAKLLSDNRREVIAEAMLILSEQGDAALPMLKSALGDTQTQYWAALVLADMEQESAAKLVPDITTALPAAVPETQQELLLALANIGPAGKGAAAEIAKFLSAEQTGVKYAATYAVGRIGESNASIQSALEQNYASDDPLLRMTSAWAIAKLNPADSAKVLAAAKEMVAGLTSSDAALQQAAAQCLADLKPPAGQLPQLVPQLVAAFKSDDPAVKESVLDVFAAAIPPAEGNRLLGLALKNPVARPFGVLAAQRLGPKAVGAVDALADALADERTDIRRQAAVALASIGAEAAPAAGALMKTLDDSDENVRRAAAQALGSIGSGAEASLGKLQSIAADQSDPVGGAAAAAIVAIAPDDNTSTKVAVERLSEVLRSGRPGEREAAVRALAALNASAGTADALKYAADDPLRSVREIAREALK